MSENQTPWYKSFLDKNERKLPYMFCFPGQKIEFPREAKDVNGVPLIPPILVIPDTDSPKTFKPFHVLESGHDNYTCLICNVTKAGNKQSGNHSNAVSHVRRNHPECLPTNCWSEDDARELEENWLKKLAEAKKKKLAQ